MQLKGEDLAGDAAGAELWMFFLGRLKHEILDGKQSPLCTSAFYRISTRMQ